MAQSDTVIEKLIVETYYISNDSDYANISQTGSSQTDDTMLTVLRAGSTTYRVYIDLKPGYKLTKIYGNRNHALKIVSDSVMYNNISGGQSVGNNISATSKFLLSQNPTVALDTWLTLGRATKKHSGIFKTKDTTGSIVDTIANGGVLANHDLLTGVPLYTEDGLISSSAVTIYPNGDLNLPSSNDSTIFGGNKAGKKFISNNASIQSLTGITGTTPENIILVAQLTTRGKISFELNIEVSDSDATGKHFINYIANGISSSTPKHDHDTLVNPYLTYPLVCGCKDPNYLEYDTRYLCSDSTACKTPVVLGCMDPMACNYDPKANLNLQNLCCYPGNCQDRDISIVCPDLFVHELNNEIRFNLYPNPVKDYLNLEILSSDSKEMKYTVFDSFGRIVLEKNIGVVTSNVIPQVNVSDFAEGVYLFRLSFGDDSTSKLFIKTK